MVALTGELGEPPERIVDLWRLDELRGIAIDGDAIVLGRPDDVHGHPPVGALPRASPRAGRGGRDDRRGPDPEPRARSAATSSNASPAGDTLPVLLAADALVRARLGPRRARRSPAAEFWPAYRRTALAPDELLLRIRIPLAGRPRAALPQGRDAPGPVDQQGRAWRSAGATAGRRRRRGATSASRSGPWRPPRSGRPPTEAVLEGRAADARDRRPRRRDPRRRAPPDRRRPLDRRVPAARRGPGPPPAHPRGRRLVMPTEPAASLDIDELDVIAPGAFAAAVAPLFEGAPRFLGRLALRAPVRLGATSSSHRAREIAHAMPADEQIELIDAHPRLGAPPATVSALSLRRAGLRRRRRRRADAEPVESPPSSSASTTRTRRGSGSATASSSPAGRGRRCCPGSAPRSRRTATPRSTARSTRSSTSPSTAMRQLTARGDAMIELGANRYGKAAIRLVRVAHAARRRHRSAT